MHRFSTKVLYILTLSSVLYGCSGVSGKNTEANLRARYLAKSAQGMTEGAKNGMLSVMNEEYAEREPNPNAYVGELLFKRYCAQCHSRGKGPDIIDHRVTTSDPESDYYIIRYGVGEMPGFRTRLTRFQIFDILAYMKSDFSNSDLFKKSDSNMMRAPKTSRINAPKAEEPENQESEENQESSPQ